MNSQVQQLAPAADKILQFIWTVPTYEFVCTMDLFYGFVGTPLGFLKFNSAIKRKHIWKLIFSIFCPHNWKYFVQPRIWATHFWISRIKLNINYYRKSISRVKFDFQQLPFIDGNSFSFLSRTVYYSYMSISKHILTK